MSLVLPLLFGRIAACAFFAILFLQSGLDKVTDRNGNLEWLTGHFSKTPFRNMVPLLLTTMTCVELATGVTSAIGLFGAFVPGLRIVAVIGLGLACSAFLMLFLGQRIAKDYEGAATLATYFAVALLSLAFWFTDVTLAQ